MYSILAFNEHTGQLLVQFKESLNPVAIDVPIENNRYLEGEHLASFIMGFCPKEVETSVENVDSLKKLDPRTPEEIKFELINHIRFNRNQLLNQSDWLVLPDTGFTPEAVARFKHYRQQLRDVPQQKGFPENVIWPVVQGEWMNHSPNIDTDENSIMELITLNNSYSGCARVLVTFETLRKRKELSRLLYPLVQEKLIKIVTNPSGFYEKLLYAEPSELEIYKASSSFRVEDLSGDLSLMDDKVLSDFMFHLIDIYPDEIGDIKDIDTAETFVVSGYVENDFDMSGSPYKKLVNFAVCPEHLKDLMTRVLNGLGVSSTFFNITCMYVDNKLYVKSLDHCAYPHYTYDSKIVSKEECVQALRKVLQLTIV